MTREEAIKILKGANNHEYTWSEYCEAYNMAIKALEQEPIIDKISVEIERGKTGLDIEFNGGIDYALSIIDKYKGKSEENKNIN